MFLIFPAAWIIVFIFLRYLDSFVGGWRSLAALYRTKDEPKGDLVPDCWVTVRRSTFFPRKYRWLAVSISDHALGLRPWIDIFHPNLEIPWSDITAMELRDLTINCKTVIEVAGFSGRILITGGQAKRVYDKWESVKKGDRKRTG